RARGAPPARQGRRALQARRRVLCGAPVRQGRRAGAGRARGRSKLSPRSEPLIADRGCPQMTITAAETTLESTELRQPIQRFHAARNGILQQVHEVIVGQDEVLEQILIALFVGGHCLITGLPGTAKTLMVRTIAQTLGLVFRRIQFTPDLMPSDITGTDIIE